jgi:hypothetical protein
MANPFQNIRAAAGEQDRSYRWYQDAVRRMATGINTFAEVSRTDIGEFTNRLEPGNMYMFQYDPKYKDTLPYYDRFPLCLPFDDIPGGFVGINFHYLPYLMRAELLGNLLRFTDKTLTEKSKIDVSWGLLKNFGRFPQVKPSVKKYLYSQVKTRFVKIEPEHWRASIFLPTQDFAKQSQQKVYRDSRDKING